MQSLLGVDLFGTHGDDMKQISDRKEHQTQNRIRGEYENREGPRVQIGAGGADGAAGLGVVGRACRGSHRGRQRDGGARGEAPLVVTEGQQEAAADLS